MRMKILLSTGYITTLLLGSVCPLQMVSAMPMPQDAAQHEELNMTPMMPPMTPVAFMSIAPVISHSSPHAMLPMLLSGNCMTGHCIMMDRSGQQNAAVSHSSVQLTVAAALPTAIIPVQLTVDSLPAPPEVQSNSLAQTVSTIVLRV